MQAIINAHLKTNITMQYTRANQLK